MWLFVAFLTVPLIEIALFIQVGGWIGLWPTLGIVVVTAALGTYLVRVQGRQAIDALRRSFSQLDDPSEPLAHGAMILVAGALLLTPGFFTDAVGFALLAPPVRMAVYAWARKRVTVARFEMGPRPGAGPTDPQRPRPNPDDDTVIEAEYHEVPRDKTANHPGSGWTRH